MKNKLLEISYIRNCLIRMEETIIFALIERAQFKRNEIIYKVGAFGSEINQSDSLVGYLLRETEVIHAHMRRYTSPQEKPFFKDLPAPLLPPLHEKDSPIKDNSINVNNEIRELYEKETVPLLCEPGDDGQYGSSSVCDATCLQSISTRVHFAQLVAESKYQDEKKRCREYIQAGDEEALMALITNKDVEAAVIDRVHKKAINYGQTPGAETDTSKINARIVTDLYSQWIIPLTKKVEILYLLQR
ncbi:MAG: chorismate mutase [Kiritimatiellae bacterium]|nr:chorismate mutase [Kiritimatiellia bacterium]